MANAALHGFSASSMRSLGYKLVGSLAPALAGIVAMGAGIGALTLRMSKFTKEMLGLATATDETVGSFARYSSQMAGVGLSKNQVSASLKSLTALGSAWSYGQVDDEQLIALAFMGVDFDKFKEASSKERLQMLVKGGFKLKAEGGEEAYNYPLSQFGETGATVKRILKDYSTYEEYQEALAKSAENATELSEETTKTYLNLSKSWEQAKQNLSNLLSTVFQPFASALTPVFDWAGTTFKDLKKKWEDSELGQSTLNFLTKFGEKAKDLFDGIGSVFSAAKKKWDESPLKEASDGLWKSFKKKVGDVLDDAGEAWKGISSAWDKSELKKSTDGSIADFKKKGMGVIDKIGKALRDLAEKWNGSDLKKIDESYAKVAEEKALAVFNGIDSALKSIGSWWESSELKKGAEETWKAIRKKGEDFFGDFNDVYAAVKKAWDEGSVKEATLDWITNAGTKISDLFGKANEAYSTLKTDWDNSKLKPALFTFIDEAKEAVKTGATDLLTAFCDIKRIWDESDTKQKGTQFVKDFGTSVYNGLKSGSDILADLLTAWNGWAGKEAITNIVTKDLPVLLDKVFGGLFSVGDWLLKQAQKARKLWDDSGAGEFLGGAFEKISEVTGNFFTWISDSLDKMLGLGKYAPGKPEEGGGEAGAGDSLTIPGTKKKLSFMPLPNGIPYDGGSAESLKDLQEYMFYPYGIRFAKAIARSSPELGETLANMYNQRRLDSGGESAVGDMLFGLSNFLMDVPFFGDIYKRGVGTWAIMKYGASGANALSNDFIETMANREALKEANRNEYAEFAAENSGTKSLEEAFWDGELPLGRGSYTTPYIEAVLAAKERQLDPGDKEVANSTYGVLNNVLSQTGSGAGYGINYAPERSYIGNIPVGTMRNGDITVMNTINTTDKNTTVETKVINAESLLGGNLVPVF